MTYIVAHSGVAPFNRRGVRRGNDTGGPLPERWVWAQAVGVETPQLRAPQTTQDQAITYERMPYYRAGHHYAPPDYLVNWTQCGPQRPSLDMRTVTMRRMVGTSNTRAQDPIPAGPGIQDGNGSLPSAIRNLNSAGYEVPQNFIPHGLHTEVKDTRPQNTRRVYGGAVQQRAGRQNRISNSRNLGQSFSQTTVTQGGRRA